MCRMASDPNRPTGSSTADKKPYAPPRLNTYGDIREIAASAGMQGGLDGALHGNTKTQ
jgi:hypothetical protein